MWRDDTPVAQIDYVPSRRVIYLEVDQNNTPRIGRDQSGAVIWQWNSDAFGTTAPTASTGVTVNLRFPGQYFDIESGLDYNLFRDYDAGSGRYSQSDPIGLAGGSYSTYTYVGGNPVNWIDPWGLDATNWNNYTDGRNPWNGPTNGNWGGKCWSGGQYSCGGNPMGNAPPTDSADACYMEHDICYDSGATKASCNKKLVKELNLLPADPGKWPHPPNPGTEKDTIQYLNMAKWLFI